uniref:Uncharacterized protein n=1 Tax=Anguilla anguilla TaxID=7936 RepID=A0A0E9P7U1_ANGAN
MASIVGLNGLFLSSCFVMFCYGVQKNICKQTMCRTWRRMGYSSRTGSKFPS